jgi:TolB-like protein
MGGESVKPASTPTGAVFLSYASQDAEAAQKICDALRGAGVEVWFDKSELRGGDAWDRRIREQIHDCRLFIPVISANSERRDEGYFRREWALAADRTRDMAHKKAFLVPVVIDGTPERGSSVPDKFHELQWTRLPGGETPPAFVERVRRLLLPEAPTARPAATAVTAASTPERAQSGSVLETWRFRPALWAIGVLLTLALSYLAVDKLWLSKRIAATANGATPSATTPEKSIAVLPFVDLSEKHDQEYFADGMAEEILNLLVKVPDLKVVGRTSSFQFKGKTGDLRQIGTVLGAAYVVEGSVRRSGDHLRVTAQLIDTRDGTHRWSETYDRAGSDTLKIQEEIATGLVRALQLEVAGSSFLKGRVLPSNNEVYDTYLRGSHALNRFDQPGMDEAVAHFRHALVLDPLFVPAAEQLARTLCDQPSFGFVPPRVGFEQARVAANAALKLDARSAIAHAVLGCVAFWYDWDWPVAEEEVKTAMAQDPNDPFVLVTAADERIAIGHWLESLTLCKSALSRDPLLATVYESSAWALVALGRFSEAEGDLRRLLEISPTYGGAHRDLGIVMLMEGRPQEALAEVQKESPVGGQMAGLVLAYEALRRSHDADTELARLESEHGADMAMWIAEARAFRGQKDEAFRWLDKAYAQKDIGLWQIKGDPLLKNLESDPRYKAFLRKMNLPE